MRKILPLIIFIVVHSATATPIQTKVLLPVTRVFGGLPGAYGSLWDVQTTALNLGTSTAWVLFNGAAYACPAPPCPFPSAVPFPPGATGELTAWSPVQRVVGGFATLDPTGTDLLVQTRVFDTSRESTNWGAYVPGVPESAAERGVIDFPVVPTTDPFRATLRIYDFDPDSSHQVRVRVYRASFDGDQLINETVVSLQSTLDPTLFPGHAELNLSSLSKGEETVRVELSPVTNALRYWAMISITNNITQNLTILTPPPHSALQP